MSSPSLLTPSSGQSPQLMEPVLGAVSLQCPATGSLRTMSIFFQCTNNDFLGFSMCLFPEAAGLSERLHVLDHEIPAEFNYRGVNYSNNKSREATFYA